MSSDNGQTGNPKRDGEDGDKVPINDAVVRELTYMFEPLAWAIKEADKGNTKPLEVLLEDVGVENAIEHAKAGPLYETIQGAVDVANGLIAVIEAVAKYDSFLEVLAEQPTVIAEGLNGVIGLVEMIIGLTDLEAGKVQYDDLGEAFLDTLIVKYLRNHKQIVFYLAQTAGYVVERPDKHDEVKLEEIAKLVGDPTSVPAEVYGWGTDELETMVILKHLAIFFEKFEFPLPGGTYKLDLPAEIESATDLDPKGNARKQLDVPLTSIENSSVVADTGFEIVPMPGTADKLPGLAVVPYGKAAAQGTWHLGGDWHFHAEGMGAFQHWGPVFRPESDVEFRNIGDQSKDLPGEIHGIAEVIYGGTDDPEAFDSTTLVGDPNGSRLAVSRVSLYTQFDYDGEEMVFTVGLPARGTIGVHPKDFDGFLSQVMPEDGIFHDFDTELGWASDEGLYLGKGSTAEASIPTKASIGPVDLQEIYLAAEPPGGFSAEMDDGTPEAEVEGTIEITAAASASVELGPVTATVKRMGVEAEVGFPEDKDGNMGFVDMEMGFSPPSGAGIAFEAGPVSGGGYLEFDPDKERYAGVLQLKTPNLTLNAIGLLTTELPGGQDGFSLQIIISAEFPPVQLGMGFTLNGVGGIIGINRSLKTKPLGKSVRNGTAGSFMFPENPIAEAPRLISDLREIFPPTKDVHVVGPMAKFGYGGSGMLNLDVGIMLSIPTWKVVLLGKLSATVPDKKSGLVQLNMAVVGVLDIPNKRASIDATLYDSKLVMWTLTGDMAMRTRWGDDPRFVLSAGGWNPRFEPPSDFPDLDRLKASVDKKNWGMELAGYLAVTSNTFQVGWNVSASAEVGQVSVNGAFNFDALFEFNPFKFVVDIYAAFVLDGPRGWDANVSVGGTFMGPGPFRLKGNLSYTIAGIAATHNLDVTFGPSKGSEELPKALILPELTDELGKPVNWRAQLPADGPEIASIRDVETDDETVLAHPMGEIAVRQTVVPLDYEIEKFGKARPSGYTKFTIADVSVDGPGAIAFDETVEEEFAPAKYRKMSDSEKIDSPAFESHAAGREMGHDGIYCGYAANKQSKNVRTATFGYESSVIDRPKDNRGTDLANLGRFDRDDLDATSSLPKAVGDSLTAVGAVAQSPVRRSPGQRFRLSAADQAMVDAQAAGVGSDNGIASMPTDSEDADTATAGGSEQVVRGGADPDVGGLSGQVSVGQRSYTIATADDMQPLEGVDRDMTKSQAQQELSKARRANPAAANQLCVVETRKIQTDPAAATDGGTHR